MTFESMVAHVDRAMERGEQLAAIEFLELPKRYWGFEHPVIRVRVTNLSPVDWLPDGSSGRFTFSLDLRRPDGAGPLRLATETLDAPLRQGEAITFELAPWLRVFEGPHELVPALHLGRADGSGPTRLVPSKRERPMIEVKSTIREAFIELTNICNFRCTFCPQVDLQRPQQMMELDLARKVLQDLANMGHHQPIRLHLMGEPLLYPHFAEFVDSAHDLGLSLRLATNGSRFQPKRIAMLFDTRVDEMVISLNTPDEASYDAQRGTDVSFARYIGGIEAYVKALIERGPPPKTLLNVLYDGTKKDDQDEQERVTGIVDEWIDCVRRYGGKTLPSAREMIHKIGHGASYHELWEGLTLQWTPYHNWGAGQVPPADAHFCSNPWGQLAILVDGRATACCIDSEGAIDVGNATSQSVAEIWRGPEITRIRQGFLKNRAVHPLCASCEVAHDKARFFPLD